MSDDEFNRAAAEALETHKDTFQKLRIAELEEQLADLQLAKSHLWADKQFLEAQCAALREILEGVCKLLQNPPGAITNITICNLIKRDTYNIDVGAALLKRLQVATVLADCVMEDYANGEFEELLKVSNRKVWEALQAWRKLKPA